MRHLLRFAMAMACASAALAQPDEGMLPSWQVEELSAEIVRNAGRAATVVAELNPADWTARGAPAEYADQQQTLLGELEQLKLAAGALSREPLRLTYAVDTFLWLDRADNLLSSVSQGVRSYYNTAVADLLDSVRNSNTDAIATIKSYMRQVAVHVEGERDVAHKEAQRCRSELVKRPRR